MTDVEPTGVGVREAEPRKTVGSVSSVGAETVVEQPVSDGMVDCGADISLFPRKKALSPF